MNYSKRISLSKSTPVTDSDSALAEDDDDFRGHRKSPGGKDKLNRNLSEKKRRDQFNMLVNELCTMVSTTNKKMDKTTILKSTISFLKDHQETANQAQVHEIKEDWKPSFLTNDEFMHLMLEGLDSFLLVFTQQGVILYSSESVTSLLGHLPCDMLNRSIYEYIDRSESASIHNMLYNYKRGMGGSTDMDGKDENQICFECKFQRGCIDPNEPVRFEPAVVRASFKQSACANDEEADFTSNLFQNDSMYFLCTVRLKASQLVREMSIVDDNKEFTSRHSLEWKFLFLDHRAPPIIGYLPFEVLGTSGYDYYHPDDLDGITVSHEQLMKTGEGTSCYYRFLTKGQQWIWLRTRFYITYHQWNSKPEFVNCTNTVVSYADVRSQKRKDLGIIEEEEALSVNLEPIASIPSNMSRCSSVASVTSGSQSDSNACAVSESSDRSQHPTSTSQVRSRTVSQQLQRFLQRHLQHQQNQQQQQHQQQNDHQQQQQNDHQQQQQNGQQQQQQNGQQQQQLSQSKVSMPVTVQTTSATSTYSSSVPLQQLLYNRQKPDTPQPARILPRPPVNDQPPRPLMMSPGVTSHSNNIALLANPGLVSAMPTIPESLSSNVFMTPVQKQLHEQLQRKASQVQSMIFKQQEELKKIHQQLLFAQGSVPAFSPSPGLGEHPPMMNSQPAVNITSPPQLPTHQHHQQQQQQQPTQPDQSQQTVPMVNVAMHNIMVNQSPVLSYPMLPQDVDLFLRLPEDPDNQQQ